MRLINFTLFVVCASVSNVMFSDSGVLVVPEAPEMPNLYKETRDSVENVVKFAKNMPYVDETTDDIIKRTRYEQNTILPRPKVGLIMNIDDYDKTVEMLGFNNDQGPYLILLEDYKFQDYDGNEYIIPAGFIFDGTSLPTSHDKGFWNTAIGFGTQVLMPDQTKYSSLAEGLIHDYMYRNPQQFSKDLSDRILYSNLKITGNERAGEIYKGVRIGGDAAYNGHRQKVDAGEYEFTEEYYKENMQIWKQTQTSSSATGNNPLSPKENGQSGAEGGSGQVCKPGDDPFDGEPENDGNGQMCPVPGGGSSGGSTSGGGRRPQPTTRHRGGSGGGDTKAKLFP